MFLARVGSFNALVQLKRKSLTLGEFLGTDLPSSDTIGRVASLIDPDTIRQANRDIYARLRRNKSLEVLEHGLVILNIDGHETHAPYERHCEHCLERTIKKATANEKTPNELPSFRENISPAPHQEQPGKAQFSRLPAMISKLFT